MNATCRLCNKHTAIVEKVLTPAGFVKVLQCMVCDRAKCQACHRSLPGNAMACAYCKTPIRQPTPTAE